MTRVGLCIIQNVVDSGFSSIFSGSIEECAKQCAISNGESIPSTANIQRDTRIAKVQ